MVTGRFQPFSAREIHPKGWLFRQLVRQAKGLSGHVHEIWPDLSENSAWLGGTGEAWERGPYYLDGLVPLAWLIGDPSLMDQKNHWVEALIRSQTPDGNFGPRRNPDIWPRLVAMKALGEEYESAKDPRIGDLLLGYCRFLKETLPAHPPKFWASARALEALGPILRWKEMTSDPCLDALIPLLLNGMTDWFSLFRHFPYTEPTGSYLPRSLFLGAKTLLGPLDAARKKSLKIRLPESADRVNRYNARKSTRLMLETHGVNLAMALKYPVVYGSHVGDSELIDLGKQAYRTLMEHHGTALGIHSADEHLSGPQSFQGTELCAVVEEMYSLEEMLRTTGDPEYADLLEFLAFNALPGMFTSDMCRHQYVGQTNQISADRRHRPFFDTNREGNLYGLAPNYGCCLANMHQGFPKFALNQVFKTENGIAVFGYSPLSLETERFGEPVLLEILGEYPFGDRITIRFTQAPAAGLRLDLRIPRGTIGHLSWKGNTLTDLAPGMVALEDRFLSGDEVHLHLQSPVEKTTNRDGSVSFRKGSLLLALPLTPEITPFRGTGRFTDVEMKTAQDWNFAVLPENQSPWKFNENPVPENPFDPLTPVWEMSVTGVRITNWKKQKGCAGPVPSHPLEGARTAMRLVPFGSTNLRIAAFPDLHD